MITDACMDGGTDGRGHRQP